MIVDAAAHVRANTGKDVFCAANITARTVGDVSGTANVRASAGEYVFCAASGRSGTAGGCWR